MNFTFRPALASEYADVDGVLRAAFTPYMRRLGREIPRALGLGFGAAVVSPYLWICLVTLPFGLWRYQEFWRFYQLHYGIGIGGILAVYVPIAAFGAVSLIVLIGRSGWVLL